MGTDSNEMFHISTARSALPIINISHDAGLNLSAEFSRPIILNKSSCRWDIFSKPNERILGLNKHLGIIDRSVIQVRTDQGLVVKIRCPMRS